jgi:Recombinase
MRPIEATISKASERGLVAGAAGAAIECGRRVGFNRSAFRRTSGTQKGRHALWNALPSLSVRRAPASTGILDENHTRWHHERMMNEKPAAARRLGTNFGNPANLIKEHTDRGTAIGNAANVARATRRIVDLEPVIRDIHSEGKTTLNQIAAELNERRIPAARGGKWSAVQVSRVLSRIAAI